MKRKLKKSILYCVAYKKFTGDEEGNFTFEFEYLHAKSSVEAKFFFGAAHVQELTLGYFQIIDVSPAVGFFVEDNHGEILRT